MYHLMLETQFPERWVFNKNKFMEENQINLFEYEDLFVIKKKLDPTW